VVWCLFDVALSDADAIREGSPGYRTAMVLVPVLGGLRWFRHGRPDMAGPVPGSTAASGGRAVQPSGAPGVAAPRGPDDDPEFIRELARKLGRDRE